MTQPVLRAAVQVMPRLYTHGVQTTNPYHLVCYATHQPSLLPAVVLQRVSDSECIVILKSEFLVEWHEYRPTPSKHR